MREREPLSTLPVFLCHEPISNMPYRKNSLISFLRTFGFITAGLLTLPVFLDVTGIWLAVPLAELLTLFISMALILRYRKRYLYL